jgi:hypothetical protein
MLFSTVDLSGDRCFRLQFAFKQQSPEKSYQLKKKSHVILPFCLHPYL